MRNTVNIVKRTVLTDFSKRRKWMRSERKRGWIDTAPVSHRYCTSGFGLQTCRLFERLSRQTSSCLGCSLSMTRKEGPSFTFCSLFGASSWFPRHIIFGPGNPWTVRILSLGLSSQLFMCSLVYFNDILVKMMTEWHVSLQESFVRNVRSITEFDHNYAVSILWRYGFFGGFFATTLL